MPTLAVPDPAVPVAPDRVKQRSSRTKSRGRVDAVAVAALALLLAAAPAAFAGASGTVPT